MQPDKHRILELVAQMLIKDRVLLYNHVLINLQLLYLKDKHQILEQAPLLWTEWEDQARSEATQTIEVVVWMVDNSKQSK